MSIMERLQNRLDSSQDDTHRIKSLAMRIENVKHTELIASERNVLIEDRARWKRMGEGFDGWMAMGPGLFIRRRLAMKLADTTRPEGKGYAEMFNALMVADGIDTKRDRTTNQFSAVLWLQDSAERMDVLREMRDAMSPGERSRMNSPITARQRVEKILKARQRGTEEKLWFSPLALLNRTIAKQEKEILELQAKLARAMQHSKLDLKRDKADEIAAEIASSLTEGKATTIARGIRAMLKQKKSATYVDGFASKRKKP